MINRNAERHETKWDFADSDFGLTCGAFTLPEVFLPALKSRLA